MQTRSHLAFALVAILSSCTGLILDGPRSDGPDDSTPPAIFSCDSDVPPNELPLPQLSRVQLSNTLQFAVRLAAPDDADAIWSAVSAELERYPRDRVLPAPGDLRGGYARVDQAIHQTQIDAMYAISEAIADELTSTTARLESLMGPCATDASTDNDRACLEELLATWAARVMRRPLSDDDVAFYASIAEGTPVDPEAVADVLMVVLNDPHTLYRVEHGTQDSQAVSELSAHELAARLSYHFWDEPPDDALWQLASDGSLLEPDVYLSEIDRLLDDPRAQRVMDQFVAQWLRLEELPPLDTLNDDPVFEAFAGSDLPPPSARSEMIRDVQSSMWHVLQSGGTVSDFLNDRRSYATGEYLAGIYGVPPWDGSSDPPIPESTLRSGLLTRPAMLATGTHTTRPIHKGYVIRNALLCQQLGAPPPNVNMIPPSSTEDLTTREAVTELTSGGVCGSCHARINPAGFVTEGFDSLGRGRVEERLFDPEGNLVASVPIDSSAAVQVVLGQARTVEDAVGLTQMIDESRLMHSCFARHYFRFAYARFESAGDGCLLAELEAAARDDRPIREVLVELAQAPSFTSRRFE